MELYRERYEMWAKDPFFSEEIHKELAPLADQEEELKDRFSELLEFGTGGLRGVLGAGTNRMNVYTVALASEGFARYVKSQGEKACQAGVCISYDSRKYSPEFAEITALVFAQHGIKARLFPELHPTPMLSYAVRYYKAAAGVMVTASHNPAKYNGYKAYGEDGGQLPPAAADVVIREMKNIEDLRQLKWMDKQEALDKGLLEYIPESMDNDYYKMLHMLSLENAAVRRMHDMKIVYTPLNGAGSKPCQRILKESGFTNVSVVPEQEHPDSQFTTCPYPNPEMREAWNLAVELAKKEKADLILATDPDSDRVGCCVKKPDGDYQVLTGNQIGLLLMDFILSSKAKNKTLPENSFVATTIVSTRLVHTVAKHFGVKLYEVLTGFKYIGELIKDLDEHGDAHYQFGFEESNGYLAGTDVRDKDAVVAIMLLAELAATCAEEGKTLADHMTELYAKYGYGEEKTLSFSLEGLAGIAKIKAACEQLRADEGNTFVGLPLEARRDYQKRVRRVFTEGGVKEEALTLPVSNVLLYELGGLDWACVRPSGTEPKLKVYVGCYGPDKEEVHARMEERLAKIKAEVEALLAK